MSYGPDRWGKHPKSTAIKAGGIKMFYRHPKLAGHVYSDGNIDEIDVSRACKLNDTFFDATPSMDSAYQEVLVDGSVITVTNTILAGVMTLQVLEQGGFVGKGCFITALQLVQSSGDNIGGTFTTIRNFNGVQRTRAYYGVFVKNVPHEKVAGNAVVPYPVQLVYAGWFDGVGSAEATEQYIWAVGNARGTLGTYILPVENDLDHTVPGGIVAGVNIHTNGKDSKVDDTTQIAGVPDASLSVTNIANGAQVSAAYPGVVFQEPPVPPPPPAATP